MSAGNPSRPQKPQPAAQPAPKPLTPGTQRQAAPAPSGGRKPKPADDAAFQRSLVTDLAGMGLLSMVMETAEHVDSMGSAGMMSDDGDSSVAISPGAAIDPGRRFVPR